MVRDRVLRVLVSLFLTGGAFVVLLLLYIPVFLLPVGRVGQILLAVSVPELAFAVVGIIFLLVIGEDRSFVDLFRPNRSDLEWTLVATIALVGFNSIVRWLVVIGGFDTPVRFTTSQGVESMFLVAGLSIIFLLVVGPSEELFFRGVVQRYLDGVLSRRGAYAWTSLLFAAFHLPGVAGTNGGPHQFVIVGVILFVVSWTLGWLYDRTRNLLVPILVHGVYNSLIFASIVFAIRP